MELPLAWWMYLLHAFSPLLVLFMVGAAAQTPKPTQQSARNADSVAATASLPPHIESMASMLTFGVMGVLCYIIWLAAHWLVFSMLDKPLQLDAYFYKPMLVAYWFPYVFGMCFVLYWKCIASHIVRDVIKTRMYRLAVFGFIASFYMVAITYLKWLTT